MANPSQAATRNDRSEFHPEPVIQFPSDGALRLVVFAHLEADAPMLGHEVETLLERCVRIAEGPPAAVQQDQAVIDAYLGQEAEAA